LHGAVILWLQLCVLATRLEKLLKLLQAVAKDEGMLPLLLQELGVRRTWDAASHPQWLVLEAEGQFQVGACESHV
jgi:hypothetical protein